MGYDNANGSFDVAATNNRDTITLNILSSTNLYLNTARPVGYFDVTGVGSQYDSSSPYFSGYYIIPRSIQDFTASAGLESQLPKKPKINLYPNPTQNLVNIASTTEITGIVITDMLGQIKFSENNLHISTKTIDISSFERGMYVFKISCNSSSVITRMIKE